ncbi:MAG: glycosyltransferase family 4 protein [Deltaproteobacteria bacterium]|nr:glycosyltransferase family 4 protein [Deltaproteobacteria bacterium]MBW2305853.1 glycosyltransferase family 4 protein [Deltaproteobacteria bacterium]
MNIAYCITDPFPAERVSSIQIAHTVNELANQGATVHLFTPATAHKGEIERHFDLMLSPRLQFHTQHPPTELRYKHKFSSFSYRCWLLKKLWGMSRRGEIDFIYTRLVKIASFLQIWASTAGFRIVYEAHNLERDWTYDSYVRAWKNNRRERRIFNRQLAGMVCISGTLLNKLKTSYPLKCPTTLIPCGVQRKFLADGVKLRPKIGRIRYVGSLSSLEGVDVLMRAMTWIEATLDIFTRSRPTPALKEMVTTLGLQKKVRFCGPLDHGQVPHELRQADCLVIPLPGENPVSMGSSPLKLFEYMASGKPIVASDVPGVKEILQDRRNAILFRASDPQSLAQAVLVLQSDTRLAHRIAVNALADAQRYTWDERARSILRFLEGIRPGS